MAETPIPNTPMPKANKKQDEAEKKKVEDTVSEAKETKKPGDEEDPREKLGKPQSLGDAMADVLADIEKMMKGEDQDDKQQITKTKEIKAIKGAPDSMPEGMNMSVMSEAPSAAGDVAAEMGSATAEAGYAAEAAAEAAAAAAEAVAATVEATAAVAAAPVGL